MYAFTCAAAGLTLGLFLHLLPGGVMPLIATGIAVWVLWLAWPVIGVKRCRVCGRRGHLVPSPVTDAPARPWWAFIPRPRVDWLCPEHFRSEFLQRLNGI